MGLATDKLFIDILSADSTLMTAIGGRLYDPAITKPDFEAENEPVPYIIVSLDGLNNEDTTKDDPFEGVTDIVQIGIEIAANTREELAQLAQRVRSLIHHEISYVQQHARLRSADQQLLTDSENRYLTVDRDFADTYSQIPYDYRFSAQAVQYDPMKPCFWQTLNYQCSVENNLTWQD